MPWRIFTVVKISCDFYRWQKKFRGSDIVAHEELPMLETWARIRYRPPAADARMCALLVAG
jgi:hypothetical protein